MTEAKHVLPQHLGGGPHGLGDPENKTLRLVEKQVLIPKIMRDRTRIEKCVPQVAAFGKCCKATGIAMVVKCRKENEELKQCSERWYKDEKFVEECTQMYLDERSEYRKTGLSVKQRAAAAAAENGVK